MRRHARALFAAVALCSFFALAGQALAVAPTVTIDPSPTASFASIQGSGTVDPGDQNVSLYAEYATDPAGPWGESFVQSLPANAGPTPVSYEITGLAPETVYFIRLDAWTGAYNLSSEVTATTLAAPDPPGVTIDPPSSVTANTAHFSGEIDTATGSNPADASWRFQCLPECPGLNGGLVTAGNSATVEADATGLLPDTTYSVSLIAESEAGQWIAGPESFTTLKSAPQAGATTVRPLRSEASVEATLNPGGLSTSYYFEYGTSDSYGEQTSAKSVPAGGSAVPVEENIYGLDPSTTYHVRLVASNSIGVSRGPDRMFTTAPVVTLGSCPNAAARAQQHAQQLADCRAYELVSPPEKNGYNIGGQSNPNAAFATRADGNRVIYAGFYPLPGSRAGSWSAWRATRTQSGWSNEALLPAPSGYQRPYYILTGGIDGLLRGATPDQATTVVFDGTTSPGGSLWLIRPDGTRQRIVDGTNEDPFAGATSMGAGVGQPWLQGISDDGRHVIFTDSDALLPGLSATGHDILYEWVDDGSNSGAGTLRVVSRTNAASLTLLDSGPAELGGNTSNVDSRKGYREGSRHAISADGSRIFFQSPAPDQEILSKGGGPVYLREDGTRTIDVSAAVDGYTPVNPPTEYQYLDAAKDGSDAFFWANGDLLPGAATGGGVYRFETDQGTLHFIGAVEPGFVPTAVASDDGNSLYYEKNLANIRLWRPGSNVTVATGTVIVAARSTLDAESIPSDVIAGINVTGPVPSATISPDGRYFSFTGWPAENGNQVAPTAVYRFDAQRNELTEVSIGVDGSPASALVSFRWTGNLSEFVRPMEGRSMSDDGSYVFFDTLAALVPEDSNGKWDAYSWHDGRVSLLGEPGAGTPSGFLGTDASGANAFLITREKLAPQDTDRLLDVYDARIDGGFYLTPREPGCEGEACQGSPSAVPASPVAGSGAVSAGNTVKQRQRKAKKKHRAHRKRHAHRRSARKKHRHRGKANRGGRDHGKVAKQRRQGR